MKEDLLIISHRYFPNFGCPFSAMHGQSGSFPSPSQAIFMAKSGYFQGEFGLFLCFGVHQFRREYPGIRREYPDQARIGEETILSSLGNKNMISILAQK